MLSLQDCSSIRLNKRHMNQIIIKDRIFGCLSGGAYCYFTMPVILKNATLEQQVERFFLVTTEKIILIKQGIEQEIRFETAT